MATITIVEGTDWKQYYTLLDDITKAALNLTGATLSFKVYSPAVLYTGTPTALLTLSVTTEAATSGLISISFADTDFDDNPGVFDWELEITMSDGKIYAKQGVLNISPKRRMDQ